MNSHCSHSFALKHTSSCCYLGGAHCWQIPFISFYDVLMCWKNSRVNILHLLLGFQQHLAAGVSEHFLRAGWWFGWKQLSAAASIPNNRLLLHNTARLFRQFLRASCLVGILSIAGSPPGDASSTPISSAPCCFHLSVSDALKTWLGSFVKNSLLLLFSKPCIVFYYRCLKIFLLSCHGFAVFFFLSLPLCLATKEPRPYPIKCHHTRWTRDRGSGCITLPISLSVWNRRIKNLLSKQPCCAVCHAPSAPASWSDSQENQ